MLGDMALALLERFAFNSVLDIGPGEGDQARAFLAAEKRVSVVDRVPISWPDGEDFDRHIGDFLLAPYWGAWDCVWACHVLEHQPDPQSFLRRIHEVVNPGGCIAVTVPPLKDEVVPGHMNLWTCGLLIYHLALAGFDCRDASVRQYGYNCSVVLPYRPRQPVEPFPTDPDPDLTRWQDAMPFIPPSMILAEDAVQGTPPDEGINWPCD